MQLLVVEGRRHVAVLAIAAVVGYGAANRRTVGARIDAHRHALACAEIVGQHALYKGLGQRADGAAAVRRVDVVGARGVVVAVALGVAAVVRDEIHQVERQVVTALAVGHNGAADIQEALVV